ncbi:MAG: PEP/pyruvate-binding domain-containing protein, partial [Anaerolineae bacterium]
MVIIRQRTEVPWILPLGSAENNLAAAGGKGANLARMVRAGLPVPGGFVVTTAAYGAYVEANPGLAETIRSAVEGLAADDPAGLEAASKRIRAGFATGSLPPGLEEALQRAYDDLGRPPVAVRSSATAEDLPGLSFAGQQDTFLNVTGEEALLQAVVRCWSSLWTARAIGYRQRQAIGQAGLALAVVVQEMVAAEAAGVLFTANPLNGKRTEMAVEATLGLGEALVSGRVEPDRYRLEAASGRVLEYSLGGKRLSIRSRTGGGTVEQAEEGAADRSALPDAALAELAGHGRRLAELLGGPQDVEWAWAGGQIYLLQSRPITALYPVPEGLGPRPLHVLFSFGAVQGILTPITPLGRSTAGAIFAGAGRLFGYHLTAETQRAVHTAGERLFIDFTGLARHRSLRRLLRGAMPLIDPGVAAALETLWDDPRLAPREGFGFQTLRRLLPFLASILPRFLPSLIWPEAQRRHFQAQLNEEAATIEARVAAAETLAERVTLARQSMVGAFAFLLPRFVPRFAAAMGPLTLLTR